MQKYRFIGYKIQRRFCFADKCLERWSVRRNRWCYRRLQPGLKKRNGSDGDHQTIKNHHKNVMVL